MKQPTKRSERELMEDSLRTEKQTAAEYNTLLGEVNSENLRNTFLSMLEDEHNICAQVYEEMSARGWQKTHPANQTDVLKVKQKFSVSS